jgi:RNA polymerase sigma-70 factor (sigma-E family)
MGTVLTGRQELAEDLVQEAFVRAASKIGTLPDRDVRPYLRVTIVNLWRNRLRRFGVERRHREVPAEAAPPPFEDRDELWDAIRLLPERQRACLVLRYYEDLSERDAAAVLGCSVGTIKSQTSRALTRLRERFSDEA